MPLVVLDLNPGHTTGAEATGVFGEVIEIFAGEGAAALGIDRETLRVRISGCLGYLVGEIFTSPSLGTLLLTGGDTLLQCMNCVGIKELEPVCEMEKGVVLARFTYRGCTRYVITKSGGFGHEKLLLDLADRIAAEQT